MLLLGEFIQQLEVGPDEQPVLPMGKRRETREEADLQDAALKSGAIRLDKETPSPGLGDRKLPLERRTA